MYNLYKNIINKKLFLFIFHKIFLFIIVIVYKNIIKKKESEEKEICLIKSRDKEGRDSITFNEDETDIEVKSREARRSFNLFYRTPVSSFFHIC